jgi:maltose alpha-D-glucosyltransferase / alpha-amylase
MQWTPYNNGGFSSAPPDRFVRPIVSGDEYGFERVSVGGQRSDPGSLLNWMAGLMRVRRECGEIGAGRWQVLETGDDRVLGLRYDVDDSAIVILNNLSGQRCPVKLDVSDEERRTATELFADRRYEPLTARRPLRLSPYGYRWLRLGGVY